MLRNIFLFLPLIFVFSSHAEEALRSDTSEFNIRKDGKKQGVWEKKYLLSKKRKSTCEYENGNRQGVCNTYYKSGFLKISTQYANNRKHGAKCFYRDSV